MIICEKAHINLSWAAYKIYHNGGKEIDCNDYYVGIKYGVVVNLSKVVITKKQFICYLRLCSCMLY